MEREPRLRCSTCGRFILEGEQCYIADDDSQPIYVNGDMLLECPICENKRISTRQP